MCVCVSRASCTLPWSRQSRARLIAARFAAIPLLVFAAPFIIMRNSVRARRIERRRAYMVMVATLIAGLWSLMYGTVVVMAFEAAIRA
jgi:hypothetical protein